MIPITVKMTSAAAVSANVSLTDQRRCKTAFEAERKAFKAEPDRRSIVQQPADHGLRERLLGKTLFRVRLLELLAAAVLAGRPSLSGLPDTVGSVSLQRFVYDMMRFGHAVNTAAADRSPPPRHRLRGLRQIRARECRGHLTIARSGTLTVGGTTQGQDGVEPVMELKAVNR